MTDSSEIILTGVVESNMTLEVGNREDLYTVSSFLVEEVLKGTGVDIGDIISIGDLGGQNSPIKNYNTVNNELLSTNDEFYVFLDQVNPEEYTFEVPFDYFPKGGPAGKVLIDDHIELNTLHKESYGINDFKTKISE